MKSSEIFKIINWLDKMEIKNYSINPDLTVDVDGKGLTEIPDQFGIVIGYFRCRDNNLTSLEGAPREVGGLFSCNQNQLTSLEGVPKEVGGSFWCIYNKQKFTIKEVSSVCKIKSGIIYV